MLARAVTRPIGTDGAIDIQGRRDGSEAVLTVSDHGPGIDPTLLPRLGEPFFRAEASRSRDSGGYGLGLSIVRRCAQRCDGAVSFRNRRGGGFEAEIRLKLQ